MSDSIPFSDAGTGRLPEPTSFEPTDENALASGLGPAGTVVLLLAGGESPGWAADAAIALGSAWARNGRRIVLADLHLENPSLHERLGTANLEGIVDVFLYGASISRSARPVRGRGFYLISAGTYEPDAEAIYRHPRWPKLVAGFREANASLLLFVPAESADLEALARWADRAVLLGAPLDAEALDPLLDAGIPLEAMFVPPGSPDLEPPVAAAAPLPPEIPAPAPAPAPSMPPRRFTEDQELLIPPPPDREERPSRGRGWMVALAILVAMAVIAAVGYLAAGSRLPGLFGGASPASGPMENAPAVLPAPPVATRMGEALPFSVQVKAFSSFPAARQELLAQVERFDSVRFFVSPEEVQGVLYFKIMAGLAVDTARANALQAGLIEAGAIDAEDAVGSWSLIRPTPFAFDLGEFPTAEEAGARADSLLVHEVPTYSVAMPYSDGSRRWQLYGGAYQDSISADAMRQRLVAAAVEPRLVLRIGDHLAVGETAAR